MKPRATNFVGYVQRLAALLLLGIAACGSGGEGDCAAGCETFVNPIAVDAGDDIVAPELDTVLLSGSATHVAGLPLLYLWEQLDGPAVIIDGVNSPQARIVTPLLSTDFDVLVFQLTAFSSDGVSNSDRVTVTVQLSGA